MHNSLIIEHVKIDNYTRVFIYYATSKTVLYNRLMTINRYFRLTSDIYGSNGNKIKTQKKKQERNQNKEKGKKKK